MFLLCLPWWNWQKCDLKGLKSRHCMTAANIPCYELRKTLLKGVMGTLIWPLKLILPALCSHGIPGWSASSSKGRGHAKIELSFEETHLQIRVYRWAVGDVFQLLYSEIIENGVWSLSPVVLFERRITFHKYLDGLKKSNPQKVFLTQLFNVKNWK